MRLPRLTLADLIVVGAVVSLFTWANTIVWRGDVVYYDGGNAQIGFAYWYQGWPGLTRKLTYDGHDALRYEPWEPLGVAINAVVGLCLIPVAVFATRKVGDIAKSFGDWLPAHFSQRR